MCLTFVSISFAQASDKDQYDIYANIIGGRGYQFYPIHFGIPNKYDYPVNDPVYEQIKKIPNKEFDIQKLLAESLRYSIGKTFKVDKNSLNRQVYFSPIYFRNESEAFLIIISSDDESKPLYSFLQAKKANGSWSFTDYYERY